MPKILVVEDDRKLAELLGRVLTEEGYEAVAAHSKAAALAAMSANSPNLLVVDRMLPDGDGLELCASLARAGGATPVLVLTALGELGDRVDGLDRGADDYVIKPFEIPELLARIRALLRRSAAPVRQIGGLRLDFRGRRLLRDGEPVDLTAREFDLLAHLVDAEGAVLSRAQLLSAVWGTERDPGTNLVEVHVSRLRGKLGTSAAMIETVRGGGYRLRREAAP
jgi:two-component system OmpR family response regulator